MAGKRRRVPRSQHEAEQRKRESAGAVWDPRFGPKEYYDAVTAGMPAGAIPADLTAQAPNNSYSPTYWYTDREFRCADCGRPEVWTAEQQKWWYEVARGPIDSTAVRCRACREARRAAHRGTPRKSHAERTRRDDTPPDASHGDGSAVGDGGNNA
jgi:hypothetical protein